MKNGLLKKIVVVVICINLCVTGWLGLVVVNHRDTMHGTPVGSVWGTEDSVSTKYTLSIGLNDKDTYQQIIPTQEAIALVNDICVKYVDGYSTSVNQGGWTDESGKLVQEESLTYTFVGAEEAQIVNIMDEVLEALNQNSIMMEQENSMVAFYSGQKMPG